MGELAILFGAPSAMGAEPAQGCVQEESIRSANLCVVRELCSPQLRNAQSFGRCDREFAILRASVQNPILEEQRHCQAEALLQRISFCRLDCELLSSRTDDEILWDYANCGSRVEPADRSHNFTPW